MMKKPPPKLYLLITGTAEAENQELFRSRRFAAIRASEIVKEYMTLSEAVQSGSIRQGRTYIEASGITYRITISEITDPFTIQTLWRSWKATNGEQNG